MNLKLSAAQRRVLSIMREHPDATWDYRALGVPLKTLRILRTNQLVDVDIASVPGGRVVALWRLTDFGRRWEPLR